MILSWQSRQGPAGGWRQPQPSSCCESLAGTMGWHGSRGTGRAQGQGLCWAGGSHHPPEHLLLPATSPQLGKDKIYFVTEIHCFSNFYHNGNVESHFSWKKMDLHE